MFSKRLAAIAASVFLITSVLAPRIAWAAAPTIVQSKASTAASSTSLSVTLTSSPAAGHTLVVTIYEKGNATITGPTGWGTVYSNPAATAGSYIFACPTSICTGTSYTFTLSTAEVTGWVIQEWSGGAISPATNGSTTNHTSTTTAYTGPSVKSTVGTGTAVAVIAYANTTSVSCSAASGWAADTSSVSSGNTVVIADFSDSSATSSGSSYDMSCTLSSSKTGISATFIVYPGSTTGLGNPSFANATPTYWSGYNQIAASSSDNATPEDSDGGLAIAGYSAAAATTAFTFTSTAFLVSSTAAQKWSFYYYAAEAGNTNSGCAEATGGTWGTVTVKINSTTVDTFTPTTQTNGATNFPPFAGWVKISGTSTALTTGNNTFSIAATFTANGQPSYDSGDSTCDAADVYDTGELDVDNVVITVGSTNQPVQVIGFDPLSPFY